jgi:phosphatidylinositol alpha 1,6-mannosyltransferase
MKIAIVTESFLPHLNGVTNSVMRVARHLKTEGHDVVIVGPTRTEEFFEGIPVRTVPSIPFAKFNVGLPSPQLTAILDEEAPDIVHAASPFALGAQAINYASHNGIPSVAIYQTDVAGYFERYGMKLARGLIDKFIATVHAPATITLAPTPLGVEYLTGLGIGRVAVWGRGVDIEQFHPNHRRTSEALSLRQSIAPAGERVIGYVGRLAAEKQVHRFAELLRIPDTHILIVGDGPERERLAKLLPASRVTFAGSLSGSVLGNAYAAMDVFVHFGTEETFGQTIQEAHAAGLPVVAPAAGGPLHLIEHGVDGYLFNPEKLEEPFQQVAALVADAGMRARMAESGRRRVFTRTWDAINAELMAHYAKARKKVTRRARV